MDSQIGEKQLLYSLLQQMAVTEKFARALKRMLVGKLVIQQTPRASDPHNDQADFKTEKVAMKAEEGKEEGAAEKFKAKDEKKTDLPTEEKTKTAIQATHQSQVRLGHADMPKVRGIKRKRPPDAGQPPGAEREATEAVARALEGAARRRRMERLQGDSREAMRQLLRAFEQFRSASNRNKRCGDDERAEPRPPVGASQKVTAAMQLLHMSEQRLTQVLHDVMRCLSAFRELRRRHRLHGRRRSANGRARASVKGDTCVGAELPGGGALQATQERESDARRRSAGQCPHCGGDRSPRSASPPPPPPPPPPRAAAAAAAPTSRSAPTTMTCLLAPVPPATAHRSQPDPSPAPGSTRLCSSARSPARRPAPVPPGGTAAALLSPALPPPTSWRERSPASAPASSSAPAAAPPPAPTAAQASSPEPAPARALASVPSSRPASASRAESVSRPSTASTASSAQRAAPSSSPDCLSTSFGPLSSVPESAAPDIEAAFALRRTQARPPGRGLSSGSHTPFALKPVPRSVSKSGRASVRRSLSGRYPARSLATSFASVCPLALAPLWAKSVAARSERQAAHNMAETAKGAAALDAAAAAASGSRETSRDRRKVNENVEGAVLAVVNLIHRAIEKAVPKGTKISYTEPPTAALKATQKLYRSANSTRVAGPTREDLAADETNKTGGTARADVKAFVSQEDGQGDERVSDAGDQREDEARNEEAADELHAVDGATGAWKKPPAEEAHAEKNETETNRVRMTDLEISEMKSSTATKGRKEPNVVIKKDVSISDEKAGGEMIKEKLTTTTTEATGEKEGGLTEEDIRHEELSGVFARIGKASEVVANIFLRTVKMMTENTDTTETPPQTTPFVHEEQPSGLSIEAESEERIETREDAEDAAPQDRPMNAIDGKVDYGEKSMTAASETSATICEISRQKTMFDDEEGKKGKMRDEPSVKSPPSSEATPVHPSLKQCERTGQKKHVAFDMPAEDSVQIEEINDSISEDLLPITSMQIDEMNEETAEDTSRMKLVQIEESHEETFEDALSVLAMHIEEPSENTADQGLSEKMEILNVEFVEGASMTTAKLTEDTAEVVSCVKSLAIEVDEEMTEEESFMTSSTIEELNEEIPEDDSCEMSLSAAELKHEIAKDYLYSTTDQSDISDKTNRDAISIKSVQTDELNELLTSSTASQTESLCGTRIKRKMEGTTRTETTNEKIQKYQSLNVDIDKNVSEPSTSKGIKRKSQTSVSDTTSDSILSEYSTSDEDTTECMTEIEDTTSVYDTSEVTISESNSLETGTAVTRDEISVRAFRKTACHATLSSESATSSTLAAETKNKDKATAETETKRQPDSGSDVRRNETVKNESAVTKKTIKRKSVKSDVTTRASPTKLPTRRKLTTSIKKTIQAMAVKQETEDKVKMEQKEGNESEYKPPMMETTQRQAETRTRRKTKTPDRDNGVSVMRDAIKSEVERKMSPMETATASPQSSARSEAKRKVVRCVVCSRTRLSDAGGATPSESSALEPLVNEALESGLAIFDGLRREAAKEDTPSDKPSKGEVTKKRSARNKVPLKDEKKKVHVGRGEASRRGRNRSGETNMEFSLEETDKMGTESSEEAMRRAKLATREHLRNGRRRRCKATTETETGVAPHRETENAPKKSVTFQMSNSDESSQSPSTRVNSISRWVNREPQRRESPAAEGKASTESLQETRDSRWGSKGLRANEVDRILSLAQPVAVRAHRAHKNAISQRTGGDRHWRVAPGPSKESFKSISEITGKAKVSSSKASVSSSAGEATPQGKAPVVHSGTSSRVSSKASKMEMTSKKMPKHDLTSEKTSKQDLTSERTSNHELTSERTSKHELTSGRTSNHDLTSGKTSESEATKPNSRSTGVIATQTSSSSKDSETTKLSTSQTTRRHRHHSDHKYHSSEETIKVVEPCSEMSYDEVRRSCDVLLERDSDTPQSVVSGIKAIISRMKNVVKGASNRESDKPFKGESPTAVSRNKDEPGRNTLQRRSRDRTTGLAAWRRPRTAGSRSASRPPSKSKANARRGGGGAEEVDEAVSGALQGAVSGGAVGNVVGGSVGGAVSAAVSHVVSQAMNNAFSDVVGSALSSAVSNALDVAMETVASVKEEASLSSSMPSEGLQPQLGATPRLDQQPDALEMFERHLHRDGLFLSHSTRAESPGGVAGRVRHCVGIEVLDVAVEATGSDTDAGQRRVTLLLAAELALRQTEGRLPIGLTPFTDEELRQLGALAHAEAASEGPGVWLSAECARRGRSPPRYSLVASPGVDALLRQGAGAADEEDPPAPCIMHCSALGIEVLGQGSRRSTAKRAAAQCLVDELRKREAYLERWSKGQTRCI